MGEQELPLAELVHAILNYSSYHYGGDSAAAYLGIPEHVAKDARCGRLPGQVWADKISPQSLEWLMRHERLTFTDEEFNDLRSAHFSMWSRGHSARLKKIMVRRWLTRHERLTFTDEELNDLRSAHFSKWSREYSARLKKIMVRQQARQQRERSEKAQLEAEREQLRREALGWWGRWREDVARWRKDVAFGREWRRGRRETRAWYRQRHIKECGGGFIGWCKHIRTARKWEMSWFEERIVVPAVLATALFWLFLLYRLLALTSCEIGKLFDWERSCSLWGEF
jgi:hypothetical protein